jgi:hypothetical protein
LGDHLSVPVPGGADADLAVDQLVLLAVARHGEESIWFGWRGLLLEP